MLSVIRKYLSVYQTYLATSFSQAMSFRIHFLLVIFVDLFFYGSSLFSVSFIFDHVDAIGPWSRDEFLFFVSFVLVVDHLHMAFVSQGYWDFSESLRKGDLDFVLLKPIGALFPIFFKFIRPGSAITFFVPWGCLLYFGLKVGLPLSSWLLIPLMVVVGIVLLISFEVMIAMTMFWTIESIGINFLRMQLQSVARWPDFVYLYFFRKVFTIFLPVLLIGSAPVKFLFDHSVWQPLAGAVVAIVVCWGVIRILWRAGLRRYESASS